jgi:hypothetical protein
MGKVTLLCVFLVFALLLEDSSSVRKKTEEEKKEEEEIQRAVNATLAEEERKRKEEEDEKKKMLDLEKKKGDRNKTKKEGNQEETKMKRNQDEACVTLNITCPVVDPCPEEKICLDCPPEKECPEVEPCEPCGPCPPVHCKSCNETSSHPQPCQCLEAGLTVPVAMMVGAITGLVAMGVATALGFLLRYAPPVVSGLLFLSIVLLTWFLSSRYPDVAREAGGRVVAVLREATVALGHRIMEAIRHHNDQVGLPVSSILIAF